MPSGGLDQRLRPRKRVRNASKAFQFLIPAILIELRPEDIDGFRKMGQTPGTPKDLREFLRYLCHVSSSFGPLGTAATLKGNEKWR